VRRKGVLRPKAKADLWEIYDYIAQDSPENAAHFIQRVEAFCLALADFPERGTRRDDLRPGMRIIGFERRVTVAFVILRHTVEIARVLYGGRDVDRVLKA
jgi:toxin ParE1/3/4